MRLTLLLLSFLAPLLPPSTIAQSNDSLLRGMRNHARPVLLFGGPRDERLIRQYADLQQHVEELRDRQMRIVLVTQTPTPAGPVTPLGTVSATTAEATALRARFHIASGDFALVLVGKDGGEKFRSAQPVSFEQLRSLVDAMPMRRQEMQPTRLH